MIEIIEPIAQVFAGIVAVAAVFTFGPWGLMVLSGLRGHQPATRD